MRVLAAFRRSSLVVGFLAVAGCAPNSDLEAPDEAEEKPLALEGALLPDIVVRESDLHTSYLDLSTEPGRRLLRLSNGTANAGSGKLHLYGVTPATPPAPKPSCSGY